MNPKGNYFLDSRKLLSKPSQDALYFVMVLTEIHKIIFWSHLSEENPEKPPKFHRNPYHSRIESIESAEQRS